MLSYSLYTGFKAQIQMNSCIYQLYVPLRAGTRLDTRDTF